MISRALLIAVFSLATTSSCFVVTDLGRYKKAEEAAPSNFSNLRVTVRGMTSHVNEQFEYRIVDNSNVIQSRGFITPLGGPDASFSARGAVPKQNGPFRFDFYADHDNSKAYDPRPDTQLDHSWRLALEDKLLDDTGTYVIVFDHNTSFTNLNNPTPAVEFGKPAVLHMRGLSQFQGKRIEVRIGDASTKRIVAMHRVPVLNATEYDILVPGMIETGVSYSIEIYTDDGKAGSIRAFRFELVAEAAGIESSFNGANPSETPNTIAGVVQVFDAQPP